MPSLPVENRNGRVLQGIWGNTVRNAFLERDIKYGLHDEIEPGRCCRMKIKTAADTNGVAICNFWDGTNTGTVDYRVRMSTGRGKVDEELWAMPASPSAGVQYSSADVLLVEMPVGERASPTTIGAASEGSESADSATWSQQSDGTPLDVWVISRIGYFSAGDKTLWAYTRKLSFDTKGRLFEVSAETRVSVDVAEACS